MPPFNQRVKHASAIPPTADQVATTKMLHMRVLSAANARYNGACPVKIEMRPSAVMMGQDFICSVPGQTRQVFINQKDVLNSKDLVVFEKICDEVFFAVWLLLDEDEDEA